MFANQGHTDWITISVLLSRLASDIVADHASISITQYRILIRLFMNPDGINVTAIADKLSLSLATITNALNNLEKHKAIQRSYDTSDKRIVYVRITENGRDLIEEIDPAIKELAHEFWSEYTAEELTLTFKDSQSTAMRHNLAYITNETMSVENAYIDSAWVIGVELGRQMKRANISLNEYRLLYLLSEQPEGMRPSDASRRLLLRSNEITVASSKLEHHGRLRREHSNSDRRSSTLFITDEGKRKLERITPQIVDAFRNNICKTNEQSFEHYDNIAHKILRKNQKRHLLL
ncbi:MAG: MarR family transcriptional regulator [Gordonibacter sp.]|nr:MarR family transcriptional regulator [Gordonibacter sp.]